jgi:flagellar hook-basal body complex protein FliE
MQINPFQINPIKPGAVTEKIPGMGDSAPVSGKDFKSYMLESLEKVNQLQDDAKMGVEKLVTGETNNVAEVLAASRKAGVAFDLLMEIRNKLMDAYSEIKQMRV